MSKTGRRADIALVEAGLAETRSKAQALIMAGRIFAGETRIEKAGTPVSDDAELTLRGPVHPWVSRGGQKLAHALKEFDISPDGQTCLDIGASTGGFTDVLLHHGAARVYAVDVGHGQLDWGLRNDPRVVALEKTNARYIGSDKIPEPIDILVCDASFIGLQTVLPAAMDLVTPGGQLIALIKPQFEVGKGKVGKGGVVRDPDLRAEACAKIETWINGLEQWETTGLSESPITGPKGNIEFLIAARKTHVTPGNSDT
jgi:23S rRNA (cytidine1920-2'-O)/16S rRNA (cytidine1409-2'-O)-methyltransferase